MDQRLDDVRQHRQDVGLPAGPAAVDPPDRRRHHRPRGRQGQLRRHHLRQGRVGAQAARGLRRPRRVLRRHPGLLREARVGQHHAAGPAGPSSRRPAAATCRPGRSSGSRRPASTRCAPSCRSRRRRLHRHSPSLQEAPADWPTLRSHRVGVGLYDQVDGQLVRRAHASSSTSSATRTEVPALVGEAKAAVVLLNDDDLTYAKIRLDPDSLATITTDIGAFADSLPRALCWTAAWDMTRDAEMAASDYLTLVLSGISPRDRHRRRDSTSAPGAGRVDLYRPSRTSRPAGSGWPTPPRRELCGSRPAATCSSPASAPFASAAPQRRAPRPHRAGCSTAARRIDGLSVDTDLRWHLLHRLVVSGAAGEDGDRRRARPGRHRHRRAARRRGQGRRPDGRGQGRGVGRGRRSATSCPTRCRPR